MAKPVFYKNFVLVWCPKFDVWGYEVFAMSCVEQKPNKLKELQHGRAWVNIKSSYKFEGTW